MTAAFRKVPRGWLLCDTAETVALAVWVGGLAIIVAAVIPTTFSMLTVEAGGRFMSRVFDHYNEAVGAAIVLLVGGLLLRLWWGRQGAAAVRPHGREIGLLSAMVAVAALITFGVGPRTVALQERAFAAESGPARQAAYADFFRLHYVVRALYIVNFMLGIGLIAVRARRDTGSGNA